MLACNKDYREKFAQPWLSAQLSAFLWLLSLPVSLVVVLLFLTADAAAAMVRGYRNVVIQQEALIAAKREARRLVDEQAKDAAQRGAGKLSEVAE